MPTKSSRRQVPPPRGLYGQYPPRKPVPELVVCCEGENTEPRYLEAFARKRRVLLLRNGNIFAPCGVPATVLKCALRQKEQKERESRVSHTPFEIWMVIDVDEHAQAIPDILKNAAKAGIKVALSNPCIEIWVLYHFDPPPTAHIHRHDAQSKLEQHMQGYDKKRGKEFNINVMTDERYNFAVLNARRATEKFRQDGTPNDNPSSTMYELLESIKGMGRGAA